MANTWFNDTFLPSLFQRAGVNKEMWLTVKQTRVCLDHMSRSTAANDNGFGISRVNSHSCIWNGRTVTLFVASNHASRIYFGTNAAERQEIEKAERQKEDERAERHYRMLARKYPERYEQELAKAIEDAKAYEVIVTFEAWEDEEDKQYCTSEYKRLCKIASTIAHAGLDQ